MGMKRARTLARRLCRSVRVVVQVVVDDVAVLSVVAGAMVVVVVVSGGAVVVVVAGGGVAGGPTGGPPTTTENTTVSVSIVYSNAWLVTSGWDEPFAGTATVDPDLILTAWLTPSSLRQVTVPPGLSCAGFRFGALSLILIVTFASA